MKTQQDKLCAALAGRHLEEITGKTRRYRVFKDGAGMFFYVGKNGALRRGPSIRGSLPVNRRLREDLLREGGSL